MKNEKLDIYIGNCQNLLHMIGELYKRGYESIQPMPNVREGTGRWRLFIQSGDSNLVAVHQWFADLGKPEFSNYEYETAPCSLTIQQLADQFIEDNKEWLQSSKLNSVNELFVKWYQALLTTLKDSDSPYVVTINEKGAWFIENLVSKAVEVIPCDFASLKLP